MKASTTYTTSRGSSAFLANIASAWKAVRLTEEDVNTPPKLADALMRIQQAIEELSRGFRTSPLAQCALFEDIATTLGADVALEHGFKRRVRWVVVDAATAAPGFIRASTTTDTTLVLTATATGTVSVLVF